jgi:acetolactate decarboxylase
MPQLECTVSSGIWQLLQTYSRTSNQPIAHIVNKALAEFLQADHHTLYQISTASALVEGVYQGAVRVGTLRAHGDLGLGTFDELDGEMVVVDGHFYQARCNGSVREVDDVVVTPFAVVTRFAPEASLALHECTSIRELKSAFDSLRQSENIFYAMRVEGTFSHIRARAVCKTEEGVRLVQAAAVQPEFDFHNVSGTLVGFWTPEYARTLNVPGYHLHFISADRTRGGHLLECSGTDLQLHIQREGSYHVALPETESFLNADLRRDPAADLARAEGGKK